ncbi:hypothetical protein SG34_007860 [Thalassomonas viridans]|uniref:Uncharacterized protein n=1 Tax=Thalassomonas viridans TaxID=137584 RepID=A0AAE9Z4X4_9GAMM|nr:hypothetical protein [Thalassomonas viridans]WDE06806.1 hypothetical protein SG34_007860 [Thalassomonas viridans]
MKLAVSQKESSLGMRIYLYMIGLVCLSANVWLSYELEQQQQSKQIARASDSQQPATNRGQKDAPSQTTATAGQTAAISF